jgi:multiple sugar transport system permease protein
MSKQKKTYSIEKKEARWGILFTIPCLLFFALFSFYPIISAFITSLSNKEVFSRTSEFIGLKNYIYLFTKDNGGFSLMNSMRATITFTLGTFIPMVLVSLVLAVFLMQLRKTRYRGFFQIGFYLPAVLSSVVAAAIWMILFDPRGIINQTSNAIFNTVGKDYGWLVNSTMLQFSTMIVYFWKYIGYFIILFITGLASIPPTLYEAATVDGAGKWHSFWRITLPLLRPTILLVSVMAMLQCLKTFSTQYMFVQGGTSRQPIDVITMNIYYTGIRHGKLGRASAMSIILFVIMLVLTILQFKASDSDDVEY